MKQIDELISRVVTGTANKEELTQLQEWLQASPENERMYQDLLTYWHQCQHTSSKVSSSIWQRIEPQLQEPIQPKRIRSLWYGRAAAAVAFLFLFSGLLWWGMSPGQLDTGSSVAPLTTTHHNPPGTRSQIQLPDGSQVWLNAASKLDFPEHFPEDQRVVYLEGEAFFEVKSHADWPFVVVSGDVQTVATGTSFNVRAFPNAQEIEVALLSGKVAVDMSESAQRSTASVSLLPGENLTFRKEEMAFTKGTFEDNLPRIWTEETIYFDGAEVTEVAEALSRWYGATFQIKEAKRINTQLRHRLDAKGKNLDQALAEISRVADYRFERNKDTVWVLPAPR